MSAEFLGAYLLAGAFLGLLTLPWSNRRGLQVMGQTRPLVLRAAVYIFMWAFMWPIMLVVLLYAGFIEYRGLWQELLHGRRW